MKTFVRDIGVDHEVDGIILDYVLTVTILYQPPWKGSMHNCPSDMDWHGFTELDCVVVNEVNATDAEGNELSAIPIQYGVCPVSDEKLIEVAGEIEEDEPEPVMPWE